eukprot:5119457-Prymnesium_polylepis.1
MVTGARRARAGPTTRPNTQGSCAAVRSDPVLVRCGGMRRASTASGAAGSQLGVRPRDHRASVDAWTGRPGAGGAARRPVCAGSCCVTTAALRR